MPDHTAGSEVRRLIRIHLSRDSASACTTLVQRLAVGESVIAVGTTMAPAAVRRSKGPAISRTRSKTTTRAAASPAVRPNPHWSCRAAWTSRWPAVVRICAAILVRPRLFPHRGGCNQRRPL